MSNLAIPLILLVCTVATLAALYLRLRADVFRRQSQTLFDGLETLELELDLHSLTHDLTACEEEWKKAFKVFFASGRTFLAACSEHRIFTIAQLRSFLTVDHPQRLPRQEQVFWEYLKDGMSFEPFPPHATCPESFDRIEHTFNGSLRQQPLGNNPLEVFTHDYLKASEDSRKRQTGFPAHFGIARRVSSSEVA